MTKVLKFFADLNAAQQKPFDRQHVSFALSEAELNQYLRYSLATTPRPGIESVSLKVFPNNYISTLTMVDFAAVDAWIPGTIPAMMKPLLSGKRTVWTDYRFQSHDGKTSFNVEKAYFEKIPIPSFVVNKVIKRASELRQPVIACLGLAYKADVDDLRESPAVEVVHKLGKSNLGKILVVEPHVNKLPHELENPNLQLADFEVAVKSANLIVLLVAHRAFMHVDRDMLKDKFVIDTVGAW